MRLHRKKGIRVDSLLLRLLLPKDKSFREAKAKHPRNIGVRSGTIQKYDVGEILVASCCNEALLTKQSLPSSLYMIFNVQCSFQTRAYLTSISFNALQTQPTIPCFDAMAVPKANYLRVDARQSCKIFGSCENLQTLRPKKLESKWCCDTLSGSTRIKTVSPVSGWRTLAQPCCGRRVDECDKCYGRILY